MLSKHLASDSIRGGDISILNMSSNLFNAPWSAFPGLAISALRLGIMFLLPLDALSQTGIDSDVKNCARLYDVESNYKAAFPFCTRAAAQGDALAMHAVGRMYEVGRERGAPSADPKAAFYWAKKSAEKGFDRAQYNLGIYYYNGIGVLADHSEAAVWFQKAAAGGNRLAQNDLAIMYLNGDAVKKDIAVAVDLFRTSSQAGYTPAQITLGLIYANGSGVPKNLSMGLDWFRKAAEAGDGEAQAHLANYLAVGGPGIEKNTSEAMRWARKSAAAGDPIGLMKLGSFLFSGLEGHPNTKEGIELIKKSADKGNQHANYLLGRIHAGRATGIVAIDNAKAFHHLGMARTGDNAATAFAAEGLVRELGLASGVIDTDGAVENYEQSLKLDPDDGFVLLDLGNLLSDTGKRVPDFPRAEYLFRRAAELGGNTAMYNLAIMNFRGVLANSSKEIGMEWLKKSAEYGYGAAHVFLGSRYWSGLGELVAQDDSMAIRHFMAATSAGNLDAEFYLGRAYWYGRGVEKDRAKAVEFFRRAAKNGNEEAISRLALIDGARRNAADASHSFAVSLAGAEAGNLVDMMDVAFASTFGPAHLRKLSVGAYWYRRAAEMGSLAGKYYFAGMSAGGVGVAKNPELAMQMLQEAGNYYKEKLLRKETECDKESDTLCWLVLRRLAQGYEARLDPSLSGHRDDIQRLIRSDLQLDSHNTSMTHLTPSKAEPPSVSVYRENLLKCDCIRRTAIEISKKEESRPGSLLDLTIVVDSSNEDDGSDMQEQIAGADRILGKCGINIGNVELILLKANMGAEELARRMSENENFDSRRLRVVSGDGFSPFIAGWARGGDGLVALNWEAVATEYPEGTTLAHELGHILGNMSHPVDFAPNVMQYDSLAIPEFSSSQCQKMQSSLYLRRSP